MIINSDDPGKIRTKTSGATAGRGWPQRHGGYDESCTLRHDGNAVSFPRV